MQGNQDRATDVAAWADGLIDDVRPVVDAAVTCLKQADPLARGEIAGAERRVRTVGVIVRAARAIVALAACLGGSRRAEPEEDEMEHRDDSPETLERLRADLESRLDRLRATLESKGLSVEPGRWPVARVGGEPVRGA